MKKTMKLLSLLLAMIMMVQMAPISALGDSVDAGDFELEAQEEVTENETETELETESEMPEDVTEPETDAPETEAPAETDAPETESETVKYGTPLYIRGLQWRDASQAVSLTNLTDGMTVNCNYLLVRFNLNVAPQSVDVKVDGVPAEYRIVDFYVLVYIELANGIHQFDFTFHGEINSVSRSFSLNVAGPETGFPELKVEGADAMILGKTGDLDITCDKLDKIQEMELKIDLSTAFKLENVEFADGLEGMCSWYKGKLTIQIRVANRDKLNGNNLVKISVKAPATASSDDVFGWKLTSAEIIPVEGESFGSTDSFHGTMTAPSVEIPVISGYSLETTEEVTYCGIPYTFLVKKSNGSPAAGVSIYLMKGKKPVLLGVTNAEGMLTTDCFSTMGTYEVYAEDANGISSYLHTFSCLASVGPADGTPYGILYSGYPTAGMTFSWMSNVAVTDAAAILRISTNADMSDAVIYNGTSSIRSYTDNSSVNRVNSVKAEGLTRGNVYYYQVGDGNVWSEIKAFRVKNNETVSFAVLGDMMNSPVGNLSLIAGAMAQDGVDYDFAIQTGNAVAPVDQYAAWESLVNGFGAFGDLGMVFVEGNEANAPENGGYFTAESGYGYHVYGDVFVATIAYTEDEEALYNSLLQMYKDVLSTKTLWQVLVIQQAPYTTDSEKANSLVAKYVPTYAEQCGVDIVFSAGEGLYARTEETRASAVTNKNGVYYVVSGSLGEHSEHTPSGSFAVTNTDYNAMYLSVTADKNAITVTAYNVLADGTVEIVDSFSKTTFLCEDADHVYCVSSEVCCLVCEICMSQVAAENYVGLVKIGSQYVFIENGAFVTGWREAHGKTYYISRTTGYAVNGNRTINGHNYVFENCVLVEGAWEVVNGVTKLYWADKPLTNTWHTQRDKTYYFFADGSFAVGEVEIPAVNENGETVYETYIFADDGALIGKKDVE